MAAVGGSSLEATINGRPFSVTADADISQQLRRYTNELRANGNGTIRQIKIAAIQMLEGIVLSIDDSSSDFEYLSAVNDATGLFDFTVAFPSGAVYAGKGQFTGDFPRQTENAAATIFIVVCQVSHIMA